MLDQGGRVFDIDKHLAIRQPLLKHSLSELGFPSDAALVDFAVTQPFQLLSRSGVAALTAELVSQRVQAACKHSSERTPCCLRGVAEHSELIKALWSCEIVTNLVSEAAGLPLRPVMDYELGCANVQVESGSSSDTNVDDWHRDSYPFVCVVMLSDPSGMTGGETMCRKADGSFLPVSFPDAGSAIVLQGMEVTHCARAATSQHQRITMVTSYVPADPRLPDNSILSPLLRQASNQPLLFAQWSEYRLNALARKAASIAQELGEERAASGKPADPAQVKQWCGEMISYLQTTMSQMQAC